MHEQGQFVLDLLTLFIDHYTNEQLIIHAMAAIYSLAILNENNPESIIDLLKAWVHSDDEWFEEIKKTLH